MRSLRNGGKTFLNYQVGQAGRVLLEHCDISMKTLPTAVLLKASVSRRPLAWLLFFCNNQQTNPAIAKTALTFLVECRFGTKEKSLTSFMKHKQFKID